MRKRPAVYFVSLSILKPVGTHRPVECREYDPEVVNLKPSERPLVPHDDIQYIVPFEVCTEVKCLLPPVGSNR